MTRIRIRITDMDSAIGMSTATTGIMKSMAGMVVFPGVGIPRKVSLTAMPQMRAVEVEETAPCTACVAAVLSSLALNEMSNGSFLVLRTVIRNQGSTPPIGFDP